MTQNLSPEKIKEIKEKAGRGWDLALDDEMLGDETVEALQEGYRTLLENNLILETEGSDGKTTVEPNESLLAGVEDEELLELVELACRGEILPEDTTEKAVEAHRELMKNLKKKKN